LPTSTNTYSIQYLQTSETCSQWQHPLSFSDLYPFCHPQILLNNLISDAPLLTVSTDRVRRRHAQKADEMGHKINIPLYDILRAHIHVLRPGTHRNNALHSEGRSGTLQNCMVLESSVSEIIVTFAIRTKKPFYKSRPSGLLLVTSILAIAFSVILTYTALGAELFKFVEMPWEVLAMIAGILLTYFANSRSRKTLLLQSVQVIGLSSPLTRLLSHIPETKPSQRYSHRQHNIAHIYKGLCICRRLLWMPEQTHPNRQGRVYQRHSIRIRRRMPPLRCRGFRNMKQQPLRPGQADVPQSDTLFRRRAGPEETWLW